MIRLLAFLLVAMPLYLHAQKGMVNFWAEFGRPTGEFRQNTDAVGIGFGMGGYFSFDKENLFYLGADLSYDIYGKSFDSDGFYEVVTNNNILQFHGVLRLKPSTGKVVPLVEGLYGFKYLYTISKLKEDLLSSPEAIKTTFHDIALSYGGSAGLHIPLGEKNTALEFRVQYLKGAEAEFVDGKSIRQDGIDHAIANPKRSTTDMIVFKIGITLGW
ncbi:MAG: hypothetical protein RIG77_09020 [Cyclobacteriaceae bacterium]